MEEPRCSHIKADGGKCGVTGALVGPNGLCRSHDPDLQDELREQRAAGGRSAARPATPPADIPPDPETAEDARKYASWAIGKVARGELDPKWGQVIQGLLREFLKAVEADMRAEIDELRRLLAEARAATKNGPERRQR